MKNNKISFSGHEKFECKIDWITKGLNSFAKNNHILNPSNIEEGIESLGLGINMIKSLGYWMKVLGIIDKNDFTEIGKTILKKDPYLENSNTLWLLHWNMVKNREMATLCNMFFNTIYPYKFTKEYILDRISLWLKNQEINLSQTTIKSDIDVFIRMYKSNSRKDMSLNLFSELKLITEQAHGNYALGIDTVADISDQAFLYIFVDYIDHINNSNLESISMDDIQRGKLSLQKSLCLGENTLYSKIHRLEQLTGGALSYSEASGMRQIYIQKSLNKYDLLNRIYE